VKQLRFFHRLRAVLKCKKGETLMESIASILIFTVLVAAITMMITLSLRITSVSVGASEGMQARVNAVLTGDDAITGPPADGIVIFHLSPTNAVNVNVSIFTMDGFTAFEP
jgi:hypothetical protein